MSKRTPFLWLSPALSTLGKRFGIDAHYYAKNSFFVVLGQMLSIVQGLIAGYFVARVFDQTIYGEYQFMLSIAGTLGLFGLPGLSTAVARAWARNEGFSMRAVTRHHLMVCLVGSLLLLGCIPFLEYYNREEFWPLFLVAALFFPLAPVAMVRFGTFTVGKARFDIALKVSIVCSVLTVLATLAVIYFQQSAMLMLMISMGLTPIIYLIVSRNLIPPAEKGLTNTKDIIKYGWQLTLVTLPVNLVWYLDKLLISHFFGLNQLATFSVALLIPEQVKIQVKQFLPVGFAKQAAAEDSKERRMKLIKAVMIGTVIFAIGIAAYIAICPFIIPLLFPKYDAQEVILLTSIAAITLVTQPGALFAQYLEAQGMIRANRIANWSAVGAFAIGLVTLIPFYGLLGAVLARGVFRFVYWGATWWFVLTMPVQTVSQTNR